MIRLKPKAKIGKYTVFHLIKQSTFCGTYKVCDAEGRQFLMKFFDKSAMPSEHFINGEIREIVYARKMMHANVANYFDDGEVCRWGRKYSYLVTVFYWGALLSDYLWMRGQFPVAEAVAICARIASGLLYIHGQGLNHNDICPDNILLEEVDSTHLMPKIIDFGHLNPSVEGNPPFPVEDINPVYCAPEALTGTFGPQNDVFSLSAILFGMIAGAAPWPCNLSGVEDHFQRVQLVQAARMEPLDTWKLFDAGCDKPLVELISSGLSRYENDRPKLYAFVIKLLAFEMQLDGSQKKEAPAQETNLDQSLTKTTVEIKKAQGNGFADVAGMDGLKDSLAKRLIWVLKDKEKAQEYRLSVPNGMILYGPPGCGKTYFAEKFAEETGFNFALVNGSDLGSTYIHGTQGKIADVFKKAEENAPCIICFDEFDSFVPSRGGEAARFRPEEVNEFLSQLNNCSQRGIFVIGTTNRLDLIDPAVIRKGRMDLHVEIPAPDGDTRSKVFAIHLKGRPLADDIDTLALAKETDHFACSDIAFIVNEAALTAALAGEPISQTHLLNAIHSNKSSLSPVGERRKIGF